MPKVFCSCRELNVDLFYHILHCSYFLGHWKIISGIEYWSPENNGNVRNRVLAIFYKNESLKDDQLNILNSRIHGSSTKSVIFMRRYEVSDVPGFSDNIL